MDTLRREHPASIIEVWFQDEMRFGQQGSITHGWARKGSRPRAVKQTEYDWSYIYAAVCPATGESSAMVVPTVNIAAMNQHLRWISEEVLSRPAGAMVKVVLVLDNAGWHTSPKVVWPSNITPRFLPPYSPELNPVERLWPCVRLRGLSNRALPSGEELDQAGLDAWNRVAPQDIKSICRTVWTERRV